MLWPRSGAVRPRANGMWLGKKCPYSTSTLTACDGRAFLTACDGQALPTACDGRAFPAACDNPALPAGLSGVGIQSENQVAGRVSDLFFWLPIACAIGGCYAQQKAESRE
jgi:hypothetical protein